MDLTYDTFSENTSNGTILIDVWAPWCRPCRAIAPLLDQVAREHTGRMILAKINADMEQDLCVHLGVGSLPTLLVFVSGVEVARKVGAAGGLQAIQQLVAPYLTEVPTQPVAGAPLRPSRHLLRR